MQFDQSTFDSTISQWRCIQAIVSVYAEHTLGRNSDNLQASCYTNLQFCQMMYILLIECLIKSLQRLLETTAQRYKKLKYLCFTE